MAIKIKAGKQGYVDIDKEGLRRLIRFTLAGGNRDYDIADRAVARLASKGFWKATGKSHLKFEFKNYEEDDRYDEYVEYVELVSLEDRNRAATEFRSLLNGSGQYGDELVKSNVFSRNTRKAMKRGAYAGEVERIIELVLQVDTDDSSYSYSSRSAGSYSSSSSSSGSGSGSGSGSYSEW